MDELLKVLSLTLPILVPGLSLIVALKFHILSYLDFPLDLGLYIKKKRILGDNKTFRGVLVMIIVAVFVSYILHILYKGNYEAYISRIFSQSPVVVGLTYSFSYILGESVNSFVKRRMNISAGKITPTKFKSLQVFFDLSDGIITVMIALLIFTAASMHQVLIAGIVGIYMHYCTDVFMKKLRLKQ